MRKITNMSMDVVDFVMEDGLTKLAKLVENLSDDAKIAYVPSLEEQQEKSEKDFALILWNPIDDTLNKYALYTQDLVELNMAFLADMKNELPEEVLKIAGANLTTAAKNYKLAIPKELQKYASDKYIYNVLDIRTINEVDYVNKTAQKDEPTLFAWEEEKKYPLHNKINIKKAASFFEKEHSKMSMEKKAEFTKNVFVAAGEHNVHLDNTEIAKYANLKAEFNPDFYNHVAVRQSYLKDHESDQPFKDKYNQLLTEADDLGVEKTAMVLEAIDKEAGLTGNYGHGVADPLMAVYDTVKVAEATIDGMTVNLEQLRNIPDGELTALIGNGGISEMKADNGLDVLAALPKPVRQDIIDLL